MRRWYLARRITLGYVIAALAISAAGWAAFEQVREARQSGDRARRTQQLLAQIGVVRSQLLKAETGERGFVLTGEEAYLEPYHSGRAGLVDALDELKRQTAGADSSVQARVQLIDELTGAKMSELEHTVELRRTQGAEAALAVVGTHVGKGLMDRIHTLLNELESDETQRLTQRIDARATHFWWASRTA